MSEQYIVNGRLTMSGQVSEVLEPLTPGANDTDAIVAVNLSRNFSGSIVLEMAEPPLGAWSTVATYTAGGSQSIALTANQRYRLRVLDGFTGRVNFDLFVNGQSYALANTSDAYSRARAAFNSSPSGLAGAGGALKAYKGAISALSAAQYRPVDFIMIGDSHELFGGDGYDDGYDRIFGMLFGQYATAIYGNNGYGFQGYGEAGGITFGAVTGAPAAHNNFRIPMSNYSYVTSGDISGVTNLQLMSPSAFPGSFDNSANLAAYFSYGTFTTGSGSFTPSWRIEEVPFTTLKTDSAVTTLAASEGRAIYKSTLPAASRPYSISVSMRRAAAMVGPVNAFWARIENVDQKSGVSCHTLYGQGGQSLYDMAVAIAGIPDAQFQNYLKDIVYIQQQRGFDPMAVVYICSGHNDRNETLSPSVGPMPSNAPTSPEAYIDNMRAIYIRFKAMWAACGFDPAGLSFLIVPSHPQKTVPDDALIVSYRVAVNRFVANKPDMSFIDLGALVTSESIQANGGYAANNTDPIHLSTAAYRYVAETAVRATIAPNIDKRAV